MTSPESDTRYDHVNRDRGQRTLSGVLWSLTHAGLTTVLTAAVFLVTSRLLTPEDFGAVALAASVILIVSMIIPMAFGEALVQRKTIGEDHLNAVFWICTGLAVVFYGVLTAMASLLAGWFEVAVLAQILPVLAIKLVLDAMAVVPTALVMRRMDFRTIALRAVLANSVAGAVCLVMAFNGFALWALVASQVLTSLVMLVVTILAARWLPGRPRGRQAMGDLMSFGVYSMATKVIDDARIEQLLIGGLLGPVALGLYFFAMRLTSMLQGLTSGALVQVFSVSLASLQGDIAGSTRFYLLGSFASAALSFPLFGGLFLVAPAAVPLVFGDQWTDGIGVVQCLSALGLIAGVGIMQAALIRAAGEARWWFWYRVVSQLAGFVLIVVLAPWGIGAIAIGFVCRTLVIWPLSVAKTLHMLQMRFWSYGRVFAAPGVATIAMAAVVLATPGLVPSVGPWALLGAQVGLGAVVYGLVLILLAYDTFQNAIALIAQARRTAKQDLP